MTGGDYFFLIGQVLGGLALFIFGMKIMTDGLRDAAGQRLRELLSRATGNRFSGLALGTTSGLLIHSSATTVMLVGFVNAGLMTLEQSIAPVLGSNIGTTLSMQVISFDLDRYCYAAIALGFCLSLAGRHTAVKQTGRALMGFGLIFLGMMTMKEAIHPYRESLRPALEAIDGSTWSGLLLGLAISTIITGTIQSSGATIGMTFALIDAGAVTSFEQVFPIVLGAHLGTCITAILGSIGTNIEARRCAMAHLIFNVTNVLIAILLRPFLFWLLPLTSPDLTHQMANLHTLVMVVAAAAVLPWAIPFARLVRRATPSRKPMPEASHLDPELLVKPESAISAAIRELQRASRVCLESFGYAGEILLMEGSRGTMHQVKLNESVINEIKRSMRSYLRDMTRHYLSRRQAILIQHIERCMSDIERIGDHIDATCDFGWERQKHSKALFDQDSLDRLFGLHEKAADVLKQVITSLDPEKKDFAKTAQAILEARDAYAEASMDIKELFAERVAKREDTPLAGIYFSEFVGSFDRVVRHAKTIALAESHPDFWIKRKKLDRVAREAEEIEEPELVDPADYLERLHREIES